MTINKAKQILNDNGIVWNNYFDLSTIERNREDWTGLEHVRMAIRIIQNFILHGKSNK